MVMTKDEQESLCRGDSVNIGFVKEDVIQMVKQGGGGPRSLRTKGISFFDN